jgi:hypothetical protein
MSFARFSEGDVYVYLNTSGLYECCFCSLAGECVRVPTAAEMLSHVEEHRRAGHEIPDRCVLELRAEEASGNPMPPALAEAVEAFRALLSEPRDLDYPVEDVYGEGPDMGGNAEAPFWSEAGLYGRAGKEAARTLLARHRKATAALAALDALAAKKGGKG